MSDIKKTAGLEMARALIEGTPLPKPAEEAAASADLPPPGVEAEASSDDLAGSDVESSPSAPRPAAESEPSSQIVEASPPAAVDKAKARREEAEKYRVEQAKRYAEQARRRDEDAQRKLSEAQRESANAQEIMRWREQVIRDIEIDPYTAVERHFGVKRERFEASRVDATQRDPELQRRIDDMDRRMREREERDQVHAKQWQDQQFERELASRIDGDVQTLSHPPADEWPAFSKMTERWRVKNVRSEVMKVVRRARSGEQFDPRLAYLEILENLEKEAEEELTHHRTGASPHAEESEGTPRDQGTRSQEKAPGRVGSQGTTAPANGKGKTREARNAEALRVARQGISALTSGRG